MTVDPVDGAKYYGTKPAEKKSELDFKAFIKLLTVQLQTQNPLEPMNDRDFFAQMAQLGQVQGMENLQKDSTMQRAQDLMGKTITATRPMSEGETGSDTLITGEVKQITIRDGEIILGVRDTDGNIVEIKPKNVQLVNNGTDLNTYSNLLGKKVAGDAEVTEKGEKKTVSVVGTVEGVSADSGKVMLQVKTEKYGMVQVSINTLQQLTN